MAKARFGPGAKVRVKQGVSSPEFPDVSLSGWSGLVEEVAAKKVPPAYLIEWDQPTLDAAPANYLERCEAQNLYFKMIWLNEPDLEPAGA